MVLFGRLRSLFVLVKTHKKKVIFFTGCGAIGGRVAYNRHLTSEIITECCREAALYGNVSISPMERPRRLTVLVNPAASDRKVTARFEKEVLPLFHVAGMEVDVITPAGADELEAMGAVLDAAEADAVYVVGGDGALSRYLTGQLRHEGSRLPVGAYPGGRVNESARSWWRRASGGADADELRWRLQTALALIRDQRQLVSIAQLSYERSIDVESENSDEPPTTEIVDEKRAFSHLTFGAFADIERIKWKYWYWAGWKRKFAYFWTSMKRGVTAYPLDVEYTELCAGCSRCKAPLPKPSWRWWQIFRLSKSAVSASNQEDYSHIINENCLAVHSRGLETSDLMARVQQASVCPPQAGFVMVQAPGIQNPLMALSFCAAPQRRLDVIREGWRRDKSSQLYPSPLPVEYENIDVRSLSAIFRSAAESLPQVFVDGESLTINGRFKLDLLPNAVEVFINDTFVNA